MEPRKDPKARVKESRDNPDDVIEPPGPPNRKPNVIEPPYEKKKTPLGPAEIK
jgi:hypothetical protein